MSLNPSSAKPSSLSGLPPCSSTCCVLDWNWETVGKPNWKLQDTAESFPLLPHVRRILNNNLCEKYSCYSKTSRKSHLCPENGSNPLTEVHLPPHSSPVTNGGERCGAGTASDIWFSSGRAFICSVFYRMFGAGSPPERHKAGIRETQLCSKTPKYFPKAFRATLNAPSCSHGNVAFWLFWSDLSMLPRFQRALLILSLKCVCTDFVGSHVWLGLVKYIQN